jgi:hypothetical protein
MISKETSMKRFLMLAVALALAPVASAELYKYIDSNGKTVYTDQPPPTVDSKQVKVQGSSPTGTPSKSALERDKELEKMRSKSREEAKKSDVAAKNAQIMEERCIQATGRYNALAQGGRISKFNAQGEREMMGDDEIAAEKEKARGQMEEACKKS